MVSFCAQLLSSNFLKIGISFLKKGAFLFLKILCLKFNFENSLFVFAKTLAILCFVVEREEKRKNNDNWNFWICFFFQKWPFRDAYVFLQKMLCWTHIFIVFWGCALFWLSCQMLDPQKKQKTLPDNWKAHFLVFWGVSLLIVSVFFFLVPFFF